MKSDISIHITQKNEKTCKHPRHCINSNAYHGPFSAISETKAMKEMGWFRNLLPLLIAMLTLVTSCGSGPGLTGNPASKPLYRDPVHDGAADPVVVWNHAMKKHFLYYTNRRANVIDEEGVSWVHGTRIGIAVSSDGGASWDYLDTCNIMYRPDPEPTYWAPEVVEHEGIYHMYLSYVPGIFTDWNHGRYLVHLISSDGISWEYQSRLRLASEKVIDACVFQLPGGSWRMWYNNETDKKSMYYADSPDLYSWTDRGKALGIGRGEGAKVFRWKGYNWMLVDEWSGLGVYRSDNLTSWERQQEKLLATPGTGKDDGVIGQHCDVFVEGERAFIFYFTHPGRLPGTESSDKAAFQRSSIQVAELILRDSVLSCERDETVNIYLAEPESESVEGLKKRTAIQYPTDYVTF